VFPGKIDPRRMQAMMKQMGISTEEIPAKKVIIETSEKRIIIEPCQVSAMTVQGQKTFTVAGTERQEEKELEVSAEDVEMVAEQTGASKKEAEKALRETKGDIAEAILKLKKE